MRVNESGKLETAKGYEVSDNLRDLLDAVKTLPQIGTFGSALITAVEAEIDRAYDKGWEEGESWDREAEADYEPDLSDLD